MSDLIQAELNRLNGGPYEMTIRQKQQLPTNKDIPGTVAALEGHYNSVRASLASQVRLPVDDIPSRIALSLCYVHAPFRGGSASLSMADPDDVLELGRLQERITPWGKLFHELKAVYWDLFDREPDAEGILFYAFHVAGGRISVPEVRQDMKTNGDQLQGG